MVSFWNNCTIKSKLYLGIGAILVVFAVSSIVVLTFVNGLAAAAEHAINHEAPLRSEALATEIRLVDADDNAGYYVMDPAASPSSLSAYTADIAAIKDDLPKLLAGTETPRGRAAITTLIAWVDTYVEMNERAFALKRSGKYAQSIKEFLSFNAGKGRDLISEFVDIRSAKMAAAALDVDANAHNPVIASIAGALSAIVGGALIALALSSQLSNSLKSVTAAIKSASDVVSTSAREISMGNSDLSQRTEEQAASLEETAASMEQLTVTVTQNAENAKQANRLAIGASDIAIKGGQVVGEVVHTMAAINESGKKIVDIISVIDGIAFQTNILALNAAVEAARAGEQGRGFAVVAGEVRTLAQRSAGAAKEIKSLIGDSVEKTNTGTRLVAQAGDTMVEIVEAVKRVTDIMSAIAAASLQQSSGIGQVNEAVTQMDKVTQQNAALVEEIAASALSLEDRAGDLVDSVGVLTLMQDRSAPLATRPKPAANPRPVAPRFAKTKPRVAARPASAKATATADDEKEWSNF